MTVSKKIPIHVELSVAIVKHGYDYIGVKDLGDVVGKCEECGHPIRYEHRVKDHHDNKKYVLGSECIYKLVALENWESQIEYEDLLKGQLLRAGKWRWILSRDGLLKYTTKIPEPKDYPKDYKDFADAMKNTVFAARKKRKEELKKESRQAYKEEMARLRRKEIERSMDKWRKFLDDYGIDELVLTMKEKDFLISVYRRKRSGYGLSEKQSKWFEDIKKKKAKGAKKPMSPLKTIEDKESFSKMPSNALDLLTPWERKFITDVKGKIERGEYLTEKQIGQANKIIATMKSGKASPESKPVSGTSSIIGKRASPWITKQKTGFMTYSDIIKVHKETDKAVLCDIQVNTSTFYKVWIPKSQIK